MRIFTTGFLGAAATDSSIWFGERAEGAESICVPFTGAAKHVSAMAATDRVIDSWDVQVFSRFVVESIFQASEAATNVDSLRYLKGLAFDTKLFPGIDDRSAGFIDWVAKHGTDFDKAAIASAACRCTFRGRMDQWSASIDQLWDRFVKAREHHAQFLGMSGTFNHYEADFYKSSGVWGAKDYDILQVDPPKIISTTDIYSRSFGGLNKVLGGKCEMDSWSWRDYTGRIRGVLEVKSKVILFQYCSDVRPDLTAIERLLSEYGKITDKAVFPHRNRFDYGLVVERT